MALLFRWLNKTTDGAQKNTSIKIRIINIAVTLASVILLLFALEAWYSHKNAIAHSLSPKSLFQIDHYFGLSIVPNLNKKEFVFHYNNKTHSFTASTTEGGYRGTRYYPPERTPDTIRIMTGGSSWTFGANVNDEYTWPAQLEKLLNKHILKHILNYKVEIINIGSPLIGSSIKRYGSVFFKRNIKKIFCSIICRFQKRKFCSNYLSILKTDFCLIE